MEKKYITDSVKEYLESNNTNYAVMISGEWGCGKTYFIKDKIFELIKGNSQYPIYISLTGVDSDKTIEEKIFKYINPFHSQKSDVAKEADFLESIINTEKQQRTIPESMVLIFDDLERLETSFLRTALGYINVFIEHEHVKCIFVCNEEEIDRDFKKIKEKYIQQTFLYRPDFKTILDDTFSKTDEKFKVGYSSSVDIEQIVDVFTKGRCFNLRTLFFALHVFCKIVSKIEEEKIITSKHKERVYQLILNYCCFYSIEFRNGVDSSILDQITVSYSQDISSFKVDLDDSEEDITFEEASSIDSQENKDDFEQVQKIKQIQEKYFSGKSIDFAYFGSVGHFIVTSYLNEARMREEIEIIIEKLSYTPKVKIEIGDIYLLNNDEYVHKINSLLSEAEKGKIELIEYMKFYHVICELNRYNVEGIEDVWKVKDRFEKGIESAYKENKLLYVSNIEYQIHPYSMVNEYNEAYNLFRDYIIGVNNRILKNRDKKYIQNIVYYIQSTNINGLIRVIIDKENHSLQPIDASEIYTALKKSNAKVISSFRDALYTRYLKYLPNNVYSDMRQREMEFILGLNNLMQKDNDLVLDTPKKLSYLQLIRLKNLINDIIDEERKEKKSEKP